MNEEITTFDEEKAAIFLEQVRLGLRKTTAAKYAKIDVDRIDEWLKIGSRKDADPVIRRFHIDYWHNYAAHCRDVQVEINESDNLELKYKDIQAFNREDYHIPTQIEVKNKTTDELKLFDKNKMANNAAEVYAARKERHG